MSSSGFPSNRLSSTSGQNFLVPELVAFVFAEVERAAQDPVRSDFAEAHSVALAPVAVEPVLANTCASSIEPSLAEAGGAKRTKPLTPAISAFILLVAPT